MDHAEIFNISTETERENLNFNYGKKVQLIKG